MAPGYGLRVHERAAKFCDWLIEDLVAHAAHEFELSRPQESGGSLRDEYLSIQRQKGGDWVHPGLVGPECPMGLEYLFHIVIWKDDKGDHVGLGGWFGELSSRRTNNGFGANPIGYVDMKAWAELTGRHPSPLEVSALCRLDAAYVSIMGRRDG